MSELRGSLRSSVAASTAPYGYTLTVWASGATATESLRRSSLDPSSGPARRTAGRG